MRHAFFELKKKLVVFLWKLIQKIYLKNTVCEGVVIVKKKPIICLKNKGEIRIKKNVLLDSNPIGYHAGMPFPVTLIADNLNSQLIIGENSRLHGCCIHAKKKITIGRDCLIAAGVHIIDSNGHISELETYFERNYIKDEPEEIRIDDNVWICLNSIILKGVSLGKGCIVSANSVVFKGHYPPYSLLMGNPAKIIKKIEI